MLHPLVIVVFVVVLLRDELGPPVWGGVVEPAWLPLVAVGPLAALWVFLDGYVRWKSRELDRSGRVRAALRAERAVGASRLAAVAWHAFVVLGLGWVESVRWWMGNWVAADELVAAAPVLGFFVLGWWSIYPIHRRLREAVVMRELDEGRPVYPILSRGKFVWTAVRHQLALVGVPIAVLAGWSEAVERVAGWLGASSWAQGAGENGMLAALMAPGVAAVMVPALQFSGTVFVFAVLPLVMRRVWDTLPLGPGPLREGLVELCRVHRVGLRDLLVWRTNGSMINGAVMGIAGPVRYIMLTDALLDALPERQVHAVMAHEIGHVRRRHMLWLLVSAVASWIGVSVAAGWLADRLLGPTLLSEQVEGLVTAATVLAALAVGLVVFGFASRRFEWQADAFAAQHLSGARPGRRGGGAVTITAEAVEAMSGALEAVARLNAIPREKFSWRHGSIAARQRRLLALVGQRADRLAIDRDAAIVKVVSLTVLLAVCGLAVMDVLARSGGAG